MVSLPIFLVWGGSFHSYHGEHRDSSSYQREVGPILQGRARRSVAGEQFYASFSGINFEILGESDLDPTIEDAP